jgi:hypothetical protein
MAFQSYPTRPIELELPDITQGATTIKRKLKFEGFSYDPYSPNVTLGMRVRAVLYSMDENGGYGEELVGQSFNQIPRVLRADRNTLVTSEGTILLERVAETDSQWQAKIDELSATQDVWLQSELFEYMRDNQPVSIPALVLQYMQVAIASKFWV